MVKYNVEFNIVTYAILRRIVSVKNQSITKAVYEGLIELAKYIQGNRKFSRRNITILSKQ